MERIAVYPGTFDPITLGHMDVIESASTIFDKVVVGLLINIGKDKALFNKEERLMFVETAMAGAGLKNVSAKWWDGLAVRFAEAEGAIAIVRGYRMATESESELSLSFNNRILNPKIIHVMFPSVQSHLHISSSAVREYLHFKEYDMLAHFLHPVVMGYITKKK